MWTFSTHYGDIVCSSRRRAAIDWKPLQLGSLGIPRCSLNRRRAFCYLVKSCGKRSDVSDAPKFGLSNPLKSACSAVCSVVLPTNQPPTTCRLRKSNARRSYISTAKIVNDCEKIDDRAECAVQNTLCLVTLTVVAAANIYAHKQQNIKWSVRCYKSIAELACFWRSHCRVHQISLAKLLHLWSFAQQFSLEFFLDTILGDSSIFCPKSSV